MKHKTFALLAILLVITLESFQKKIHIKSFNEQLWKKDSLGCLGIRDSMVTSLQNNQNIFKNYTQKEIIEILGNPNYKYAKDKTIDLIYLFRDFGQCSNRNIKFENFENVDYLLVLIKNNKVIGIAIIAVN